MLISSDFRYKNDYYIVYCTIAIFITNSLLFVSDLYYFNYLIKLNVYYNIFAIVNLFICLMSMATCIPILHILTSTHLCNYFGSVKCRFLAMNRIPCFVHFTYCFMMYFVVYYCFDPISLYLYILFLITILLYILQNYLMYRSSVFYKLHRNSIYYPELFYQ